MESIDFKQRNVIIGEGQPQYLPLYANKDHEDPAQTAYIRMKLDPVELAEINRTGEIWLGQLTFGHPYAPIRCTVLNPFEVWIDDLHGNRHRHEIKYPAAFNAIWDYLFKKGFSIYIDGSLDKDHGAWPNPCDPLVFTHEQLTTFKSILDFQLAFPELSEIE